MDPTGRSSVTVRAAGDADVRTLVRLAALDSASIPQGPTLLAELAGEPVAALPLGGGPVVADPFRHTTEAVALLELRAAQLRDGRRRPAAGHGRRLSALLETFRALPLR